LLKSISEIKLKKIIMKKNIGTTDKIIRIIVAAVLAVLYLTGTVHGILGIIFLIAAVVLVVTTLTGFCGLYKILGISTCPVKTEAKPQ
jgi:outer membrane murein-binding lipoprotein Lpp